MRRTAAGANAKRFASRTANLHRKTSTATLDRAATTTDPQRGLVIVPNWYRMIRTGGQWRNRCFTWPRL